MPYYIIQTERLATYRVCEGSEPVKRQLAESSRNLILPLSPQLLWIPHIWMDVSIEDQSYIFRIDHLRRTGAHVKFLSLEPLFGPISNLNLEGIDWVIVGGESGPKARPIKESWVVDIRN